MITPVNLDIVLRRGCSEDIIPEHLEIPPKDVLDKTHFVEKIDNFVASRMRARIFAVTRISVYTKQNVKNNNGTVVSQTLDVPQVKYSYKYLAYDNKETQSTEHVLIDNYLPINGEIPRDQILPLPKKKSIFSEWKTSLHIFRTASYKIISNEIYNKPHTKLKLRAIVCTVAVPAVALMGILIPFAACYFNRIVGKLNLWMIDFCKEFQNEQTDFAEASKRSFTPELFADYIGVVNVSKNSGIPQKYLLQFVRNAIAEQKLICTYLIDEKPIYECDAQVRTKKHNRFFSFFFSYFLSFF